MRRICLAVLLGGGLLSASPTGSADDAELTGPVSVSVPAIATIWLAAQPAGTVGPSGDVAPTNSPLQVDLARLGNPSRISIEARGTTSRDPVLAPFVGPDGEVVRFSWGPWGYVGGLLSSPFMSLTGVFANSTSLLPAPPSVPAVLDAPEVRMDLQEAFFVGDGLTGTGAGERQIFHVPAGADTLYLAAFDTGSYNNAGHLDVTVTAVPELFEFRLSKTTVAGCLKVSAKMTLAAPAPAGGVAIDVASDNPHAVVPASVLVKAGQLTKSFPITTTVVTAREVAVITASDGYTPREAALTLRPIGPKSVTLLPNPVVGGSDSLGTVRLECPAGPGDITVALSSTKPAIAQPTSASVTVPAGEQTVPFTVMTNPVFVTSKPAIKATANGVTKSKALVVNPAP